MAMTSLERDLLDRETGLTDHLGSTARGKKTDLLLDQALGQVKQSSLVIDGDDSCWGGKEEKISIVHRRIPRLWCNSSGK